MSNIPKLIDKKNFDTIIDEVPVSLYTLNSGNGLIVQVTNFGLHIVSVWCKDKNGKYDDVVLGYKNIESYTSGKFDRYVGSIVGRYANRIAKGEFKIGDETYHVPINNNGQSLHGGIKGLDLQAWKVDKHTEKSIEFSFVSPNGAEGYPGKLTLNVQYKVTKDNSLEIRYKAVTDKATVVNLSNHAFFNLKGEGNGTILDHVMKINASNILPVDEVLIPTGELMDVSSTPFDFRKLHVIGDRIEDNNEQLKFGAGYDHCWVIEKKIENAVEHIATLAEPVTGRQLDIYTNQPGVQCYTGNFFDGSSEGKHGQPLRRREGIALETQKFPDSPNKPNFPSTLLNVGDVYEQTCIYKFSTSK